MRKLLAIVVVLCVAVGAWSQPLPKPPGSVGTAAGVRYDDTQSGIGADNVQDAIDTVALSGGGPGGGAPVSAQYLVLQDNPTLQADRIFTPNPPLVGTDGGADSPYDLDVELQSTLSDGGVGVSALDWILIEKDGTTTLERVQIEDITSASGTKVLIDSNPVTDIDGVDLIGDGSTIDVTWDNVPTPDDATFSLNVAGAETALDVNDIAASAPLTTSNVTTQDGHITATTHVGAGIKFGTESGTQQFVMTDEASLPPVTNLCAEFDQTTGNLIFASGACGVSSADSFRQWTDDGAGTATASGSSDDIAVLGGTGIATTAAEGGGNASLTIDCTDADDDGPGEVKGCSSFFDDDFDVVSGSVTIAGSAIEPANMDASGTLGNGKCLVLDAGLLFEWVDCTSGSQFLDDGGLQVKYDTTAAAWYVDLAPTDLNAMDRIVGGNGVIHVVDFDGGGVGGSDIVAAITAASAGDTIVLPNQSIAVTDGQVDLNKAGLTLTGLGESSELTASGSADLVHVSASDVTVKDLLLTSTASTSGAEAIRCNPGTSNVNLLVENVKISMVDTTGGVDGISINGCDHTSIRNVDVTADRGAHIINDGGTFPHVWVSDSTFTGGDEGIDISGARTVSVRNSLFNGQDVDGVFTDHAASILVLESNRFNADAGADNVNIVEGCLTSVGNAYAGADDALVVESTVNDITCITSANDVISGNVVNLATGLDLALLNATGGFGTTGSTGTVTNVPLNRLPVLDSNDDLPLPGDLTIGSSTLAWDAGNSELDLSTDLNVTGGVQANSIDIACDGVGGCFVALKDNSATPATPAAGNVNVFTQGTGTGAIPGHVGYVDDNGDAWRLQEALQFMWFARGADFTPPQYTSPAMNGVWSSGSGNGNLAPITAAYPAVRTYAPAGYVMYLRDFAVTNYSAMTADCEVSLITSNTMGGGAIVTESVIQIGPASDNCSGAVSTCTDENNGRANGATYTGPDVLDDVEQAVIEGLNQIARNFFVAVAQHSGEALCDELTGVQFNVAYDLIRDEN